MEEKEQQEEIKKEKDNGNVPKTNIKLTILAMFFLSNFTSLINS